MARPAFRPPTLRTAGIAASAAGVIALVAPFAWRSFWPTPIATIDAPDAGRPIAGCFVAKGRVLPSTIWGPLWLIEAWDGSGWRPLARIDPAQGTWRTNTCVRGRTGGHYHLALVVADRDRDDAFDRQRVEIEEALPEWMTATKTGEQGCRRRPGGHGFDPIPDGAKLVAATAVTVLDGDEVPCSYSLLHGPGSWTVIQASPSLADERNRRGRHDERRILPARGGLQRAGVGGVAGRRDGVGAGGSGRLVELPVAD